MPHAAWQAALLEQIAGAIAGGVDVVQIRERGINDGEFVQFIRDAVTLTRGSATRIVINDRTDLALVSAAAGVHLREDSIPIDAARRLSSEGFVVGRSVHDATTAANSRTADYLIGASVFETVSKPGQPALGLEGLRELVRAAGDCPVWALGGITVNHARELVACGVRGVAAIGAFIPPCGTRDVALAVQQVSELLRFSFDTAPGLA